MSWSINLNVSSKGDEKKSNSAYWLEKLTSYVAEDSITQAKVNYLIHQIVKAEDLGNGLELSDSMASLLKSIIGDI